VPQWLLDVEKELPKVKIFLYEKSQGMPSGCHPTGPLRRTVCTILPNVGREAQVYLHHIVSRYSYLSEKVVFAQAAAPGIGWEDQLGGGHMVSGSDFFHDYLSPLAPPWIVLSGWTSFTGSFMATPRAFKLPRTTQPESCPEGGWDGWDVVNDGRDPSLFFTPLVLAQRDQLPSVESFWNEYLRSELGPITTRTLMFAQGGVMSASRAAIAAHPLAFYKSLLQTVGSYVKPASIFFLEFTWG
jgi:hypothetical protein